MDQEEEFDQEQQQEEQLVQETKKLNVKAPAQAAAAAAGGGGGPKFSFKTALKASAVEFVPSWGPPTPAAVAPVPVAAPIQQQQYQQQQQQQYQQYTAPVAAAAPVQKAAPAKAPVAAAAGGTAAGGKASPKKNNATVPASEKKAAAAASHQPSAAAVKAAAQKAAAVAVPDEPEEEVDMTGVKENVNILFMGHVDAGKSTMGGHILLLTGMVDKRTMEKYEQEAKELGRESWYLSWALDLNQEERDKGKTTEYGRGAFVTENRHFTIIDAPGHRNYIPSMIEGAAQADIGILVISARRGEFETGFERDGQTREHALLAKTAGVKRIIMVINKMDDPTVNWDKARYDEIVAKIMPYLRGVGYAAKDVDVLPISGFTGANMKDVLDPAICDWWTGKPLLTLVDEIPLDRKYTGPFLMPIADKTKDMGTVAMGKIESGHIKKGSTVMIMPTKKTAEVLAIFNDESEIPIAHNGDNVRIRLKGVDEEDVLPGFVLCTSKNPVHAVTQFEVQLQIVEYPSIMCAGYSAIMHAHTTREEVSIAELLHKIDKKTKRRSKAAPKFIKQGDVCIVRIEATRLVCLETYDDYPQLGRFTLRDENRTVAVGKILKLITE